LRPVHVYAELLQFVQGPGSNAPYDDCVHVVAVKRQNRIARTVGVMLVIIDNRDHHIGIGVYDYKVRRRTKVTIDRALNAAVHHYGKAYFHTSLLLL
jgi:hypothetical protein